MKQIIVDCSLNYISPEEAVSVSSFLVIIGRVSEDSVIAHRTRHGLPHRD